MKRPKYEEYRRDIMDNAIQPDARGLEYIKNNLVVKRILVEELANPVRKFNVKNFARKFKVHPSVIKRWMKDDKVRAKVKEKIHVFLGDGLYLARIYKKMTRQALAGSYNHQRLLLEISREYIPGAQIDVLFQTPESRFAQLEKARVEAKQKVKAITVEHRRIKEHN